MRRVQWFYPKAGDRFIRWVDPDRRSSMGEGNSDATATFDVGALWETPMIHAASLPDGPSANDRSYLSSIVDALDPGDCWNRGAVNR